MRARSARQALLFGGPTKRHAWWLAAALLVAVVVIAGVLKFTDLDWETVQRFSAEMNEAMERLPAGAVLPLMAVLPIFGFPIALVYLVAGARFGALGGGVVVAVVTLGHLLGSYLIARSFLRRPIERLLEKRRHHLPQVPEDEQALVCVIAALAPGIPYFLRNYVLAIAGVRLRFLLLVVLPIYVARSYVTILLGDLSGDPSRTGLLILGAIDALKVAICAAVIWRLRAHHRKFHGSATAPAIARE
jgi:uncharacterized membrane protein YdjX (TVP38/TMEM64 family)